MFKKKEKTKDKWTSLTSVAKGGPGSGNFGHAGRPGEVGGSDAGGAANMPAGQKEKDQEGFAQDEFGQAYSDLTHSQKETVDERVKAEAKTHKPVKKDLWPSLTAVAKGGPGSGNFGHSGRPGEVGGSGEGGSGVPAQSTRDLRSTGGKGYRGMGSSGGGSGESGNIAIATKDLENQFENLSIATKNQVTGAYKSGANTKEYRGKLKDIKAEAQKLVSEASNEAQKNAAQEVLLRATKSLWAAESFHRAELKAKRNSA